ncbi:GntR family transcriptional regulator [Embleya sp. NPDC008237]|uniref:GntR family transcriptional regulator n=1 Tax=Embleya sp. NPDC008237 TaxID=3363978 RepID=UPI0036E5E456
MRGYRDLADDLRRRIDRGEFPPGSNLPRLLDLEEQYDASRLTLRRAVAVLADEGLVVPVRKRGTVVRTRSAVRIPLSRYVQVMQPGGSRGPWESACFEQGLDGRMTVVFVRPSAEVPERVATLLQLSAGETAVHRRRFATIGTDDVVQVQDAWYPSALAEDTPIARDEKIVGGVFGALAAAGHVPAFADERVSARAPSPDEASHLMIGGKVPVIVVERLTRKADGTPIEVLEVVAPADRVELVYDGLPLLCRK